MRKFSKECVCAQFEAKLLLCVHLVSSNDFQAMCNYAGCHFYWECYCQHNLVGLIVLLFMYFLKEQKQENLELYNLNEIKQWMEALADKVHEQGEHIDTNWPVTHSIQCFSCHYP